MIRATLIDKQSPFLGEECALCKHPLSPGEDIVICPEDGSRHHVHCWQANGNKCTAYGCMGGGEVITTSSHPAPPVAEPVEGEPPTASRRSKVRVLPSSSFGCAQGCLLISIAISILLFAVGCFGLWAIADYIMLEVLGWPYRVPLDGAILPPIFLAGIRGLGDFLIAIL